MKPADPLLLDFIRQALDYNPETGELIWVMDWGAGLSHTEAGRIRTFRRGNHDYRTRVVGIDHKRYTAHQLIWFWMTGEWAPLIDHKDGDSLNNRWTNLRKATVKINAQNRRQAMRGNPSGKLGVTQRAHGFEARIKVNGRQKQLGTFDDPETAHQVYVEAKRKYHPGCTI